VTVRAIDINESAPHRPRPMHLMLFLQHFLSASYSWLPPMRHNTARIIA